MGLGHFLDSAAKAVGNVAKAGEWAVTHPDKVISGAGKVLDYAVQHPGDVAKIAGKELVHSLTDPKELAINAALIVGTAGAGFAAKEAAELGVKTGAKVAGEVVAKTAEETAAKTGEKVAAKTVEKTAAKTAEEVGGKTAARSTEQKLLETGRHNPVSRMITNQRTGAAQKFLAAGGENPSALRQAGAALIQGTGGTAPTRLEGMSDVAYSAQKMAWRGKQLNTRAGQVQGLGKVTEAAAHPVKTAMNYASKNPDAANAALGGNGQQQRPVSQPGTTLQPLSQPTSNAYTPGRGFAQMTPGPLPAGYSASANAQGGITYQGMGGSPTTPGSSAAQQPMSATDKARQWMRSPQVVQQSGMRAWQGPHREMFGGIDPNYDWRKGYENRPGKEFKPKVGKAAAAPAEAEQPGAYEVKSGQQPMGALNPGAPKMTALGAGSQGELGPGPRVHFGQAGARPMGPAGGRKASFYNAIDVNSQSDDDYKFEPGGQGYLDFPDMPKMGMGTMQPLSQPKRKMAFASGAQQTLGV